MSEELFLSPTTIKTHLARLYGKLGVSSRTAALARAREEGLLD
ncbi:MAG: LuxR C-terminal-related transcriptional regulator [Dermabacter sp.]|nr:LuxR C-terminal-related transcriptional regulator [Dermabacter sp.]